MNKNKTINCTYYTLHSIISTYFPTFNGTDGFAKFKVYVDHKSKKVSKIHKIIAIDGKDYVVKPTVKVAAESTKEEIIEFLMLHISNYKGKEVDNYFSDSKE